MTTSALVPVNVDQDKVLATLGLNVRDPSAQAALLVCERYGLDPLLKHLQLIKQSIYITRDGYLHVAHQSGAFDGMELVAEGETEKYYWAKVAVYRKDMSRPFVATARCRKDEQTFADKWDQAVTRAERRALKRAFNVAGVPANPGDYDDHTAPCDPATGEIVTTPRAAIETGVVDEPGPDDLMTDDQRAKLFALLAEAGVDETERHDRVSDILGERVDTFTTLTIDDARFVIDRLEAETPVSVEARRQLKARFDALPPALQQQVRDETTGRVPNVASDQFTRAHLALLDDALSRAEAEFDGGATDDPFEGLPQ